ncbi:MAG TPA: ATP-binding protein, partial [Syntrophorhabdaceae bacterium]
PGFNEPKGILFTPEARRNAIAGIATYETLTGVEAYPVRVLTWPVVDGQRVISVVRVGMSRINLYRSATRFLLTMALLFPFALALAGGGGWFFAHRALGPVDRMIAGAREIGANRLHERLPLSGARDELDRLAETINNMLGRLDAAFSEMRQFTADASHELQTPLTILRGEMEVALRSRREPKEYKEVLESALEEVERLSQLVEGLLLLARSDAGVLKMDHAPVELAFLIEEVRRKMAPLAEAKSVNLGLGRIEPAEVQGDYSHLRRLLLNLVDNGIKYNRPGGSVRLSLGVTPEWAVLEVEDTGPGVAEEEKEKIFQRFYRSPEARSGGFGGSGLGLSMVRSIVDAHHGKIELESSPGKGSTFRVHLPAQAVSKD